MIFGSSWRSEPAAALRGLANTVVARLRLALVERAEVGVGHVDLAAHLDDRRRAFAGSFCGISLIVRILAVTSSPS